MFQFSGLSPIAGSMVFNHRGCPIRTSADQSSFATPRSLSQLTTSFVVSESLGIPHTLLFASFSYNAKDINNLNKLVLKIKNKKIYSQPVINPVWVSLLTTLPILVKEL